MHTTDDSRERVVAAGLAVIFAAIAALAVLDLIADLGEGTSVRHALIEGGSAAVALGGAMWMTSRHRALAREARALSRQADALSRHLEASRADAARWRDEARDLIAGLGAAIDRQLDQWALTPAEKEIALLLLKGLSHKEVAEVRGVSEATVRQQARSIYKKAGLEGRHDLAAFFLEDLLGPATPAHDEAQPSGGPVKRSENVGPPASSR
ncbi:MAG TPA: LuxR C-terminal-related transcriptional regulator [Kofleriaceae bacterium]|nr:LuxR C-terminal-related transcriptional regulator [Kofleriaceae bacterium]